MFGADQSKYISVVSGPTDLHMNTHFAELLVFQLVRSCQHYATDCSNESFHMWTEFPLRSDCP